MTKKLSFDKLPAAVEKILEILSSGESEQTALPQLLRRMTLLEKKIDQLQRLVSPDRPTMDMPEVCRVLKLRPKAVNELAMSGVLPSREQGRKMVFYEDGVVRYFVTQGGWKAAEGAKPVSRKESSVDIIDLGDEESAPGESASGESTPRKRRRTAGITPELSADGTTRLDINAASEILGRSPGAIRQQLRSGLPHHRDGRSIYFIADELRQWSESHPPRPRKNQ